MAPTPARHAPDAWKPWAALGVATVGLAALSAQPASALSTYGLDNTADQTSPATITSGTNAARSMFSNQRRFLRTFKMGPTDGTLKDISLGLFTTQANTQLTLNIYEVSPTTPFAPLTPPTGTTAGCTAQNTACQTFTIAQNTGTTTGTWFSPTLGTSLTSFIFQAGKNYGISFSTTGLSTGGPIGFANCIAANLATCPNKTFQTAGGITLPIATGGATLAISNNYGVAGSWIAASADLQSAFMEINFNPASSAVPAPALMGFSSLSGLLVYSRRLRSRIKGSVA
jgi:hypothetical protein